MTVTSVNGQTGVVVLTAADVEAIPSSAAGEPNGIATLNSGKQLPEEQLPSSVVTGSALFYPENYGAGTTEDDTAALQACFDAAAALSKARIILGPEYKIASSPRHDRGGYACVALPNYGASATQLRVEGVTGGTSFVYSGPETAYSSEYGCPTLIGGPTPEQLGDNSNMAPVTLEMFDCHASLSENSTIGGFDFSRINSGKWNNITVSAPAASAPTHKWVFGMRFPESNNGNNLVIGYVSGSGLYTGIIGNVHMGGKYFHAYKCVLALGMTGDNQYGPHDGHSSIVTYLTTELCNYHLASWSPTEGAISMPASTGARLLIGLWDIEDNFAEGLWWNTTAHILDANNQLYGDPRGTPFGRVGHSEDLKPLIVTGAANFPTRNIKLSPLGSGRIGEVIKITASNAAWPVPPSPEKRLEVIAVSGGCGGGGGGSSSGIAGQVGAGGGGAGAFVSRFVEAAGASTLDVVVGSGGAGGAGGTTGGHAGSNGSPGSETSVTGTGVNVLAKNEAYGEGSAANSSTSVGSLLWGTQSGGTTNKGLATRAGEGGGSGLKGGLPFGQTGGGGGGGGTSTATNGGAGGQAGSTTAGGTFGATGGSGTAAGGEGESAAANTGAGGGGGGGGSWNGGTGGAGGRGGAGGSGLVLIRVVG